MCVLEDSAGSNLWQAWWFFDADVTEWMVVAMAVPTLPRAAPCRNSFHGSFASRWSEAAAMVMLAM